MIRLTEVIKCLNLELRAEDGDRILNYGKRQARPGKEYREANEAEDRALRHPVSGGQLEALESPEAKRKE